MTNPAATVGALDARTLGQRLAGGGLAIRTGPFVTRLRLSFAELAAPLRLLYDDFPVDSSGFADFDVAARRMRRGRVGFLIDGERRFSPVARGIALPMLEWAINWCIYTFAHQYLLIHAAVVEREGRALIMAGPPGAGKSTLCAALVGRGWRLFSDEFAVISFEDGRLWPIARPISLKNDSIERIRRFAPDAVFGPVSPDTHKGRVALMRPPTASVRRAGEPAAPGWIVFPNRTPEGAAALTPVPKARAFFRLADNAFNYHFHGAAGFEAVCRMIDACDCLKLAYADLDDAVAALGRLADGGAR